MNGKHCWKGVGGIVMGINTQKSSLKVHYTVNDPHVLLPLQNFVLFNENENNFPYAARKKIVSVAQKTNELSWSREWIKMSLKLFHPPNTTRSSSDCAFCKIYYTPVVYRAFSLLLLLLNRNIKIIMFFHAKVFSQNSRVFPTHTQHRRRRLIEMQYLK